MLVDYRNFAEDVVVAQGEKVNQLISSMFLNLAAMKDVNDKIQALEKANEHLEETQEKIENALKELLPNDRDEVVFTYDEKIYKLMRVSNNLHLKQIYFVQPTNNPN